MGMEWRTVLLESARIRRQEHPGKDNFGSLCERWIQGSEEASRA